jgi:hypothetical protein
LLSWKATAALCASASSSLHRRCLAARGRRWRALGGGPNNHGQRQAQQRSENGLHSLISHPFR